MGASSDDEAGTNRGAVWILFLNSDGTVKSHQKIHDIENSARFGWSIANIGDLDDDNVTDIAVGSISTSGFGDNTGAIFILFLNSDGTVKKSQQISRMVGGFDADLSNARAIGLSVCSIGDLDLDGVEDIAIGTPEEKIGENFAQGSIWILFLNSDGTVKSYQKIAEGEGNFKGNLDQRYFFGTSLCNIGDLDKDGVQDLAVGAIDDFNPHTTGIFKGAVWILFMNHNGTVKSHNRISNNYGYMFQRLESNDEFGNALSKLEDIDGDGNAELIVAAIGDESPFTNGYGSLWVLFLESNGLVKSHQKINLSEGNFFDPTNQFTLFGTGVTVMKDLNGDGIQDIVVGEPLDNDQGQQRGAIWTLFMNAQQ